VHRRFPSLANPVCRGPAEQPRETYGHVRIVVKRIHDKAVKKDAGWAWVRAETPMTPPSLRTAVASFCCTSELAGDPV